jgi:hypothetical protein
MIPDAVSEQMSQMIKGYWISQIVGTLARLGIPDRLAGRPLASDVLASAIGCDPRATYRLLRASAMVGVVTAMPGGHFGLTPLGQKLRSNTTGSMRDVAVALTAPAHWLPWGRLIDAIRQGQPQTQSALGQELFQYYAENADEGRAFTGAMSHASGLAAEEVAHLLDTSGAEHVVDVGGASGTIIAALLGKNPTLSGTIFELAHVVPDARKALAERGLSLRCQVVEGDFFKSVPNADLYILRRIIHDWDDEQSIRILSNCARALRRNGRVVLLEQVLPEDHCISQTALADLNMLVLLPGRERSAKQFRDLLQFAGLRLDRITPTTSPLHIIEAVQGGS